MASFLPVCTTIDEAIASYAQHGGALIRFPVNEKYDAAVEELYQWCEETNRWAMANETWRLGGTNRSFEPSENGLRFSVNHWKNAMDGAWQGMQKTLSDATKVPSKEKKMNICISKR